MAAAAKKREVRKSVRQPGWITLDGGFAARPCVVQDFVLEQAARSRSTIQTCCRADCGWRFRATRAPGGVAKWSRAAARPSASSSSASAGRSPAIQGGMRSILVLIAVAALLAGLVGCRRAALDSKNPTNPSLLAGNIRRKRARTDRFLRGVWRRLRQG